MIGGIAAGVFLDDAASVVRELLELQIHRGSESAGIACANNKDVQAHTGNGSIETSFLHLNIREELLGSMAIGYNGRMSGNTKDDLQPIIMSNKNGRYGSIAIAFAGKFQTEEYERLRADLKSKGTIFQTESEAEIIAHLMMRSRKNSVVEAIQYALSIIPPAYSLLILTKDVLIAARDKFGIRPLSLASINNGFLIGSETNIFQRFEGRFLENIKPGEMLVFEKGKPNYRSICFAESNEHLCAFEAIHKSDPHTTINGLVPHVELRQNLGKQLFAECKNLQGDFIVPILYSGKHPARGLSEASGIKYREYFLRNQHTPRYLTLNPSYAEKRIHHLQKHNLLGGKITGKVPIVVDAAIGSSDTIRITNERLRHEKPTRLINLIASPPITCACRFGDEHSTKENIIAAHLSQEEIRKIIGADMLYCLSLEGLKRVFSETYGCGICTGCFGGKFPE